MKSHLETALQSSFRAHRVDGWVREYKFHPHRRWRFDFAFLGEKIAVEIQGGTYVRGKHSRGRAQRNDIEKHNAAVVLGWRVLYGDTDMVRSGELTQTVLKLLNGQKDGTEGTRRDRGADSV